MAVALLLLAGCAPKVQVEAPKEPIVINLNVKIEHEIRVKVDEDLEDLFKSDDELF
ncbi:MAG: YnbE family lipoprotein [Myxococcales bacterium]|nr:YnbE family lipoprotein [Myxococcales bacterium]